MDVDSPNLKRCSSAPQINNLLLSTTIGGSGGHISTLDQGPSAMEASSSSMDTSANSLRPIQLPTMNNGQSYAAPANNNQTVHNNLSVMSSSSVSNLPASGVMIQKDPAPTSFSNIFTPRVRRFSASFSPLAVISNGSSSPSRSSGSCTPGGGPRLTPRISQLRQEESADVSNSREVNHEREIHSAMQISQSYEDLTLVTENWSFSSSSGVKHMNDDLINPLHVALPSCSSYCSSPSPTSRGGLALNYPSTSPSPTRKFVTRRSMSPCPIRPSSFTSTSVKRKFDLEDTYGNCYSPPPLKKMFSSERGTSPVCQTTPSSPLPICPSPDSSTTSFENGSSNTSPAVTAGLASSSGRVTPKFFLAAKVVGSANTIQQQPSQQMVTGGMMAAAATTAALATTTGGGMVLHPSASNGSIGSSLSAVESPRCSSLSSSSTMMMDCGVSSSCSARDTAAVSKCVDSMGCAPVSSSAVIVTASRKDSIDCDEDITDLNVVDTSPADVVASIVAVPSSTSHNSNSNGSNNAVSSVEAPSEAVMEDDDVEGANDEEELIKSRRCLSDIELTGFDRCERLNNFHLRVARSCMSRSSSSSSSRSTDNNNESTTTSSGSSNSNGSSSSNSICPSLAFGTSAGTYLAAASSSGIQTIAET